MRVFRVHNPLAVSPVRNEAGVHVLLHPSAVRTAPHLEDGLDAYTQDVLTAVPTSLAGLLALSVPIIVGAEGDGWLGVGIVGQWGCEKMVLAIRAAI